MSHRHRSTTEAIFPWEEFLTLNNCIHKKGEHCYVTTVTRAMWKGSNILLSFFSQPTNHKRDITHYIKFYSLKIILKSLFSFFLNFVSIIFNSNVSFNLSSSSFGCSLPFKMTIVYDFSYFLFYISKRISITMAWGIYMQVMGDTGFLLQNYW